MTYIKSWKSHRLTSHTWLGLNPQIGRPLSRIVGAIGFKVIVIYLRIYEYHSVLRKDHYQSINYKKKKIVMQNNGKLDIVVGKLLCSYSKCDLNIYSPRTYYQIANKKHQ
jgi:kynureninase